MEGAAAFKAHDADCVIGFGGGAALDVAKVVGIAATHDGDILEYAWDHPQVRPIEKPLPYFVALPTTAGTGSEVGRSLGGERKREPPEARDLQREDSGQDGVRRSRTHRSACRPQ